MNHLSAEELALMCRQMLPDDTRAFEAIVARYKNRVFATAYRLLKDREEAEDQAQEIFLKIYRGIGRLSDPATFEAWLRRITVNTCLDALEKRKTRPAATVIFGGDEETGGFDVPANANSAADSYENKEILNCLEKALAKMEPHGRAAVVLRDIEELSYEEIAASLKVGLSAVKMRIHRARLAVQKLIEEVCPGIRRSGANYPA